jgi:hypothetical protein
MTHFQPVSFWECSGRAPAVSGRWWWGRLGERYVIISGSGAKCPALVNRLISPIGRAAPDGPCPRPSASAAHRVVKAAPTRARVGDERVWVRRVGDSPQVRPRPVEAGWSIWATGRVGEASMDTGRAMFGQGAGVPPVGATPHPSEIRRRVEVRLWLKATPQSTSRPPATIVGDMGSLSTTSPRKAAMTGSRYDTVAAASGPSSLMSW